MNLKQTTKEFFSAPSSSSQLLLKQRNHKNNKRKASSFDQKAPSCLVVVFKKHFSSGCWDESLWEASAAQRINPAALESFQQERWHSALDTISISAAIHARSALSYLTFPPFLSANTSKFNICNDVFCWRACNDVYWDR